MSPQQFETLLRIGQALLAMVSVFVGFAIRISFVLRRIDRRTLLQSLEHEALMQDYMFRHPQYERPAAALAKAQKLGL